ncbi:hypothetical protein OB905_11810 [Halobacteria archaeon AArc-dxtr1]|nr:hypothetical protein [Halobacteria archaeon AArc-dxtr1]
MNPFGGMKQKAMKGMVSNLIQGEAGDIITGLIASKEIDLLTQVVQLHEAIGLEGVTVDDLPTKEDRKDAMKGLIEAIVSDDVPGFFFDEALAQRLDNPEKARRYLDLEGDEWVAKIDQIEAAYRKRGDERPRSEILADYINRNFGVDVGTFVTEVVIWTDGQRQNVASSILLGNFEAVGSGIERATEAIEEIKTQQEVVHAPDE